MSTPRSTLIVTLAVFLGAFPGIEVAAFDCEGVIPEPGGITAELVAAVSRPVDATAPAGDTGRLFVVEQGGRIRIIDLSGDNVLPTPFLDIQSRVRCCGERGLLGLAFHPDYATNGEFFVYYSRSAGAVCSSSPPPGCTGNRDSESVVARYRVSEDPNVADPMSEEILLSFCQPYSNHNGGQLAFGPNDGYLYISTGDGGSGGDPCNSGQRMESLLGKLLRIDVDGGDPYAIPEDNPFDDTAGARPEIFSLGLRNPWRFSFDPGDPETGEGKGDIYIGDVGQGVWEEIDYSPAATAGGENYEWRRREGDHNYSGTPYAAGTIVEPIFDYPHSGAAISGRSVTGGVVYRGCRLPDIHGRYFFADYANDWVRSFNVREDLQGGRVPATSIPDHTAALNDGLPTGVRVQNISAFGVDGRGEVYILDVDGGRIVRIVPSGPPNMPPTARIASDPDPAVVTLAGGEAEVMLDGSASDDGGDGPGALTYRWRKVRGPTGASIGSVTGVSTVVTFTRAGDYTYSLTVNDTKDTDVESVDVTVEPSPFPDFRRGDSNGDGNVDISDGVRTLVRLFLDPQAVLPCADAADANDSGDIDQSDAIYTLNFLFIGGNPFPEPLGCGADPGDEDALDCESYPMCEG